MEWSLRSRPLLGLAWVVCATAGCGIATTASLSLYPDLGFARNPLGEFHEEMLLFAGLIGFGLGLAQSAVLGLAGLLTIRPLFLWVFATTLCVAGMILPLWWVDAEIFFFAPWYAIIPTGPGLLSLAIIQALLMSPKLHGPEWLFSTILGGAIGVVGGLLVALIFTPELPFEVSWAGSVALGMAIFQRRRLVKTQN